MKIELRNTGVFEDYVEDLKTGKITLYNNSDFKFNSIIKDNVTVGFVVNKPNTKDLYYKCLCGTSGKFKKRAKTVCSNCGNKAFLYTTLEQDNDLSGYYAYSLPNFKGIFYSLVIDYHKEVDEVILVDILSLEAEEELINGDTYVYSFKRTRLAYNDLKLKGVYNNNMFLELTKDLAKRLLENTPSVKDVAIKAIEEEYTYRRKVKNNVDTTTLNWFLYNTFYNDKLKEPYEKGMYNLIENINMFKDLDIKDLYRNVTKKEKGMYSDKEKEINDFYKELMIIPSIADFLEEFGIATEYKNVNLFLTEFALQTDYVSYLNITKKLNLLLKDKEHRRVLSEMLKEYELEITNDLTFLLKRQQFLIKDNYMLFLKDFKTFFDKYKHRYGRNTLRVFVNRFDRKLYESCYEGSNVMIEDQEYNRILEDETYNVAQAIKYHKINKDRHLVFEEILEVDALEGLDILLSKRKNFTKKEKEKISSILK